MFESRVLSFGVLTNDSKIDILVSCRVSGNGFAENNGGVDVKLLTHGDVPGSVTRSLNGSVKNT